MAGENRIGDDGFNLILSSANKLPRIKVLNLSIFILNLGSCKISWKGF